MDRIFQYLIYIIIISVCCIKCYAKVFHIFFNDTNFRNLNNILNDNRENDELVLYFDEQYYDMNEFPFTIDATVHLNISFVGNKNGTIFDYNHGKKGRFIFYNFESKGVTIKMENIIFENFNSLGAAEIDIITFYAMSDNVYFIFNNCIIQNNNYRFFRLNYNCNAPTHSNPSIIFNDCDFM